MLLTYQQTLDYLYTALPMFQRVGAIAFKKDLTNTIILCDYLGNPQNKFKSIHVAGTNGKGSSSHMLASVLQEAGYKTGLYTSPHLKNFTERIRVDGIEADKEFVIDFTNRIKPLIGQIQPSFFEITVAMAFDYFALHKVDIAVIETGLGGRLDSTNIIHPVLSLITNIGSDHKDLLGDKPEQIAFEKAGIIKRQVPVVISQWQEEVANVFMQKAVDENANLYFASNEFSCQLNSKTSKYQVQKWGEIYLDDLEIDLAGHYQRYNLPGVLKSIELLRHSGFLITDENLRAGLKNVINNTGLKGRWQILSHNPLMVCDTGHNLEGIQEVLKQIAKQHYRQLHIVWGSVKDKDVEDILRILPKQARYYFCEAKIPRAMPVNTLQKKAAQFGLNGIAIADVNTAVAKAIENADDSDMIFVGGSTFVVAELNEL